MLSSGIRPVKAPNAVARVSPVGGALSSGAVLALGVMPYVTARIVLRLGRTVAPAAYEPGGMLSDPAGITRWTRRITFACALVQSVGFARFVQSIPGVVTNPGLGFIAQTVVVLTTGAMGVAWLAERMTSQRDSDDVDIEDVSGESPLGARAQV